jgi:putative endonuclease
MKRYHVYILASFHRVLYIGITADLEKRLAYHRALANPNSFTARYGVTRLVHVEEFTNPDDAIAREKQLKGWLRAKKVALIEKTNPDWEDLAPAHTDPSPRFAGSG